MNKTELIAKVAEKAKISKKDAEKVVSATVDSIVESVASNEKVQIVGFGSFEIRSRAERKALNPRTKVEMTIPATKSPVFKAGKAFKDAVK